MKTWLIWWRQTIRQLFCLRNLRQTLHWVSSELSPHPSVPVQRTATERHRPFRHWTGQYSPAFFRRYSRLQATSGSSLPSLQSIIELQNACSGTHVPSRHLKPLPGHSRIKQRDLYENSTAYSIFFFSFLEQQELFYFKGMVPTANR